MGWFNDLPTDELEDHLRACNAAGRFVREMAAGRPYADAGEIADAAEAVTLDLDWAEVAQALAAHPRIGDRAGGESAQARSSRTEQASMDTADDEVRAALAAGNRAYEERFGHVYVIRAAGRSAAEMLAELRRRLDNVEANERGEVTGQLAEITRLRVEKLVSES
ncbi:MAG: 2-oxo-4-hydroxy-4-carboxy-5-ureidoimidazoline decarboxylase [Geodermatophilaceae bacterium]|nr:2-oxo-4-hydroxy-4-carboxy-5-ureidoimidazoline decarboxylase [Geodermatophilaceae bacterium]